MSTKTKRKPRSDRNHLIYLISNKITKEEYIGLTVMRGQAINKSLRIRFEGHISKAIDENKPWALPTNIRTHGFQNFSIKMIEIIRGKASAHKRETELINIFRPALNTKMEKG